MWCSLLLAFSCLPDVPPRSGWSDSEAETALDAGEDTEAETDIETGLDSTVDHDSDGFSVEDGDCDDSDAWTVPGIGQDTPLVDRDCDGVISTSRLLDADVRLLPSGAGGFAGNGLGSVGDVDGDGLADVGVGAPELHDDHGRGYLLLGATLQSMRGDWSLGGSDMEFAGGDESLGANVITPGDLDGDGLDDLLISGDENNQSGASAGKSYLFLSSSLPAQGGQISVADADFAFLGESAYDDAGQSVSGAGDVDGDGVPDLLIGAYGSDEGDTDAGKAYLVLGSTVLPPVARCRWVRRTSASWARVPATGQDLPWRGPATWRGTGETIC